MNNNDAIFPAIKRNIENLIEDQEGNIPANRLLILGTMILVLGSFLSIDAFAAHGSHKSHGSHGSHSSHSSGSHGSHYNHGSHSSHVSHQSHTSHSNTGSHSNSLYSIEGDVSYPAPSISSVSRVAAAPIEIAVEELIPPPFPGAIQSPESTSLLGGIPTLAVPAASVNAPDPETINIAASLPEIR